MILYDIIWYYMIIWYDIISYYMILYHIIWYYMVHGGFLKWGYPSAPSHHPFIDGLLPATTSQILPLDVKAKGLWMAVSQEQGGLNPEITGQPVWRLIKSKKPLHRFIYSILYYHIRSIRIDVSPTSTYMISRICHTAACRLGLPTRMVSFFCGIRLTPLKIDITRHFKGDISEICQICLVLPPKRVESGAPTPRWPSMTPRTPGLHGSVWLPLRRRSRVPRARAWPGHFRHHE